MFGVDSSELFIVAVLALIFIGPKELPSTMRLVGRWVGRAKAHARHFTSGIENMMREAELEEMEKRWREENERIMREHPVALPYAGASEEHGAVMMPLDRPPSQDPAAPSDVGERSDERASTSLGTNEIAASDEPPLPLPEPEHHRRELP
ncbi:Sec-independent protein translocase protein TatB [Sphingomonas rosea]|uniref:Sec-independent protein translocase protein TatB n=1 Tax=Sphingomonas rosea TaxID=335605 RepID=A0ABP7U2L2_9SPHN